MKPMRMNAMIRAVLAAAITVTSLSSLAGTAQAEGVTATTAVESYDFDTPVGDVDYQLMRLTVDGDHANGIKYELNLRAGDAEGTALKSFDGELAYLHRGLIGPKMAYSQVSLGGSKTDQTRLGLAARYDIGTTAYMYGDLMTDADNLADEGAVTFGAGYLVNDALTVWGEVGRDNLGLKRVDSGELGASYKLNDRVALDGRVSFSSEEGADGVDMKGVSAGLTFPF